MFKVDIKKKESVNKLDFCQSSIKSIEKNICKSNVVRVINGKVYRSGKIVEEDLWIADGKVMDAQQVFYDRSSCSTYEADEIIDAKGMIVAPGFIDIQINGAYGVDFSDPAISKKDIDIVRKNILSTGCTSICPTIITTDPDTYKTLLPLYNPENGSVEKGCALLGVHAEGPFISPSRAGAHPKQCIQPPVHGEQSLLECYGSLDNIRLITLAPELEGSLETIRFLKDNHITISIGHTAAHINEAESGVKAGATLITHLFNAMTPFHHRDPGVIGLLGMPSETAPFYSIIVDGIHSCQYSVNLAQKANGEKCVLITDAMAAMGLADGHHKLGKQRVIVANKKAVLEEDPETLAGAIVTIDECVRLFKQFTGCSVEEAIRNATQNPAKVLNLSHLKGDLLPSMDGDFVLLDEDLQVHSTYISGKLAWKRD